MCPRSGYEIKQMVDRSTRFFWTASYGQIYPELKRLEESGLVSGADSPTGGRQKTVYELTAAGSEALRAWLRTDPQTFEMRHEGMLMSFFADALPAEERAERLLAMRDQHLEKLAQLEAVETSIGPAEENSPRRILRFGIEFNKWIASWCEETARDLAARQAAERSA